MLSLELDLYRRNIYIKLCDQKSVDRVKFYVTKKLNMKKKTLELPVDVEVSE